MEGSEEEEEEVIGHRRRHMTSPDAHVDCIKSNSITATLLFLLDYIVCRFIISCLCNGTKCNLILFQMGRKKVKLQISNKWAFLTVIPAHLCHSCRLAVCSEV